MHPTHKPIALVVLLCVAALAGGCVATDYQGPNGTRLRRVSLFGDQTVGTLDLTKGTLKAYESQQAQIAGAAVEAAVRAATTKP